MSYFGNATQQQQINPQNIAMAEQELEMITDTFNRIVDSCYSKCLKLNNNGQQAGSGELNENCIDNCVAKFFETNAKVGAKMQEMSQQQ